MCCQYVSFSDQFAAILIIIIFSRYSLVYPDLSSPVTECSKCDTHATCPGGDVLQLESGYWRIDDQSSYII